MSGWQYGEPWGLGETVNTHWLVLLLSAQDAEIYARLGRYAEARYWK